MDAILGKMTLVEEGTQKATRLNEAVAELDAQLSRVTARVPFVENAGSAVERPQRRQRRRRPQAGGSAGPPHGAQPMRSFFFVLYFVQFMLSSVRRAS